MEFKKEDVVILAKAVAEDAVSRENLDADYDCDFCSGARVEDINDFKHEINCPVLVAQDILTGVC